MFAGVLKLQFTDPKKVNYSQTDKVNYSFYLLVISTTLCALKYQHIVRKWDTAIVLIVRTVVATLKVTQNSFN